MRHIVIMIYCIVQKYHSFAPIFTLLYCKYVVNMLILTRRLGAVKVPCLGSIKSFYSVVKAAEGV